MRKLLGALAAAAILALAPDLPGDTGHASPVSAANAPAACSGLTCGGNGGRSSGPANTAARRFRGRAIGNSASGPVAKHAFPVGAGYQLRFQDHRRADTAYRLCAWMGGRRRGCKRGRTGQPGTADNLASYDIYNPQSTGLLIWRWYVGGRRVARWDVAVTTGD